MYMVSFGFLIFFIIINLFHITHRKPPSPLLNTPYQISKFYQKMWTSDKTNIIYKELNIFNQFI